MINNDAYILVYRIRYTTTYMILPSLSAGEGEDRQVGVGVSANLLFSTDTQEFSHTRF